MAVSRIDEAGLNVTQYGNRNLIINGAMQVAQRGTSSSSQGHQTLDRFQATSDSTYTTVAITQEQSADGPDGFAHSYKITVGTTESLGAGKYFYVQPRSIEAQNLQHLAFGSSAAKKITLSFWVKSSVTGTYTMSAFRHDAQRIYPKTYTIDAANTWEYKTITMDGDTTGTIANDTGRGIDIYFILSAGSNYKTGTDNQWAAYVTSNFAANHVADVLGTTSATWQITGVQLEVGDTATPFEHRSYGDEVRRCERYYQECIIKDRVFTSYNNSSASYGGSFQWRTIMRAAPTVTGGANADAYPSNTSTPVNDREVIVQTTYQDGCEAYLDYDTASAHSWFVRADSLKLDAEI